MDWVYVVTNKSILNLAKIGVTTNHPTTRAIELSNLGAPHCYIVEYAASVDNPRELKKSLHKYFLSEFNLREGKEWTACSIGRVFVFSFRVPVFVLPDGESKLELEINQEKNHAKWS